MSFDKQSSGGYDSQLSANAVARGRGTPFHQRSGSSSGRGQGRDHGPGRGSPSSGSRGGFTNNSNFKRPMSFDQIGGQNRPKCQVCMKLGHTTNICWY
jgi:hypothetical protein